MNRPKLIFAVLGTALLLSCSEDLKPIERETLEEYEGRQAQSSSSGGAASSSSSLPSSSSFGDEQKASVSGVSQKGPFVNNSSVTLYELGSDLAQKGRSFLGMTDDKGSFEINGIELASPYVLLEASGYYRNEVTGKVSSSQITLYAIADITNRSNVNVNILTHLEYHRVLELVKRGQSLADAKRQALGDILAVFGIEGNGFKGSEEMSIFGSGNSDAALLAISVLLQGNLSEGDFSALLADFSQKLKESGKWDDKAKKAGIAEWASSADLGAIRGNILGWSSSVPEFEKYIGIYVATYSGDCIDTEYVFCHNGYVYSKCGNQPYDPISQFCLRNSIFDKCDGNEYVPPEEQCNAGVVGKLCGSSWYNPSAKYCLDNILYSCNEKPYNPVNQFCHSFAIYDKCGGSDYNPSTQFCYNSNKVGTKCGSRTELFDPDLYECRDGGKIYLKSKVKDAGNNEYDAVLIGSQTWLARNLNHNASGSRCYGDNTGGDSQNRCGTYGRLYDWATAMEVCPSGWHLPSDEEWDALISAAGGGNIAGTKLKSKSGWNKNDGTDEFDFSAMPGGFGNVNTVTFGDFNSISKCGIWWSATGRTSDTSMAYYRSMVCNGDGLVKVTNYKTALFSVRCLKN